MSPPSSPPPASIRRRAPRTFRCQAFWRWRGCWQRNAAPAAMPPAMAVACRIPSLGRSRRDRGRCRVAHRRRQGHGLARAPVDVNGGDLANRGDFAGFRIAHLVHETQRLVADLEKTTADFDDLTGQEFALVGDVLLHRRHPPLLGAQIGGREPDARHVIPIGFVELAHVPHDVHVADLVALPRIDATLVGDRVQDWVRDRFGGRVHWGRLRISIRYRITAAMRYQYGGVSTGWFDRDR